MTSDFQAAPAALHDPDTHQISLDFKTVLSLGNSNLQRLCNANLQCVIDTPPPDGLYAAGRMSAARIFVVTSALPLDQSVTMLTKQRLAHTTSSG